VTCHFKLGHRLKDVYLSHIPIFWSPFQNKYLHEFSKYLLYWSCTVLYNLWHSYILQSWQIADYLHNIQGWIICKWTMKVTAELVFCIHSTYTCCTLVCWTFSCMLLYMLQINVNSRVRCSASYISFPYFWHRQWIAVLDKAVKYPYKFSRKALVRLSFTHVYTVKPLWTDTPRMRTLLYYGRFFRSVT
jgi:hypothetical protein